MNSRVTYELWHYNAHALLRAIIQIIGRKKFNDIGLKKLQIQTVNRVD